MSSEHTSFLEELCHGIVTNNVGEMHTVASRLSKILNPSQILALSGDLGSGKTTFVKGLAAALGIKDNVNSPSFNIYSFYQGTYFQLLHMDAYRLNSAQDFENLLLEEFMRPPWILAIEWPEKIQAALPDDTMWFHFKIEDKTHRIQLMQQA